MRLIAQLVIVSAVMCGLAELIICYSMGLLDYRDRVQASVSNLSIKPRPMFAVRDARIIQFSTSYEYKGVDYTSVVQEALSGLNYEFLEDSELYVKLARVMKSNLKVDLAINPLKPSMPRLVPDLHMVRLYGYMAGICVGMFVFFQIKKGGNS